MPKVVWTEAQVTWLKARFPLFKERSPGFADDTEREFLERFPIDGPRENLREVSLISHATPKILTTCAET